MSDTSGPTSYAPFARWDRDSQSWRTSEATSLWDLELSSLTLPAWGGLRDGELCEHPTPERLTSAPAFSSLPTPSANDTTGAEDQAQRQNRGAGGPMLRDLPTLLPTPTKGDGEGGGKRAGVTWESTTKSTGNGGASRLRDVVSLLPTPAVNDMGEGKTLEWWDDWAPRQKAADGRPAPHGRSLAIKAQRLLPTPTTQHSSGGYNPDWGHGMTLLDAAKEIVEWTGPTTRQPFTDGKQSSTDQPPTQPSQESLALPA